MHFIERVFGPGYETSDIDFTQTKETLTKFATDFDKDYLSYASPDPGKGRMILQVSKDPATGKLRLEAKKSYTIGWVESVVGFFTGSFRIRNIFTVFQRVMAEIQATSQTTISDELAGRISPQTAPGASSLQSGTPQESNSLEDCLVTCCVLFHREGVRDTKEYLRFLVKKRHVDINKTNSADRSPLIEAIRQHKDCVRNNIPLILCLVQELQADLEKLDNNGISPLSWSVCDSNEKPDLVRALIHDFHANPNLRSNMEPQSAFEIAVRERFLKSANILRGEVDVPVDFQEIFEHQELALIWGLGGRVHWVANPQASSISLERSTVERTLPRIQQLIYDFCKQPEVKSILTGEEVAKLREAYEKAITRDQELVEQTENWWSKRKKLVGTFLSKYLQKRPFIISQANDNHTVGLVVYDGKIAICNRGPGTSRHAVEIFQLDPARIREADLTSLFAPWIPLPEFRDSIARSWSDRKGPITLEQKRQKVSNCTWASLKVTVHALSYLLLKERGTMNEETVQRSARKLYKLFTSFTRQNKLENYLDRALKPNREVLQKILIKVVQHQSRYSSEKYSYFVRRLLDLGTDLEAAKSTEKPVPESMPALSLALAHHDMETLGSLITNREQANTCIAGAGGSCSLLQIATSLQDVGVVRFLIEKGARDYPTTKGMTALKIANAVPNWHAQRELQHLLESVQVNENEPASCGSSSLSCSFDERTPGRGTHR